MTHRLVITAALAALVPLAALAAPPEAPKPAQAPKPPAVTQPARPAAPAATAPAANAAPAATPPSLTGGASAVSETHGDWTVGCRVVEAKKVCSVSQQQVNEKTRQRMIALEFTDVGKGAAGVVATPFGLLLPDGLTLDIDGTAVGGAVPFRTCLPVGCVARVAFEGAAFEKLKTGAALNIAAKAADTGQAVRFAMPLRGLAQALTRAREFAGS